MTEMGFAFLRHVKPLHGIPVEQLEIRTCISRLIMAARIAPVSILLKSVSEERGFLDE